MNWYSFLKYSQNWQAYVQSIGASDDDVQVLESIDSEEIRNIVINELRKNPGTTASQILENIQPKREVEHTPWELRAANRFPSGELSKWILVQLRRLRKSPKTKEVMLKERGVRGHGELVQEFEYDEIIAWRNGSWFPHHLPSLLNDKTQEIIDWYNAERPQMASYTLSQATIASDEWHERISSKTDATSFEEGEKNVVYGPQWNNPEWNGWTVRRILTANDVQYEGYAMEHCVGSYDCDVVDEKTKIYSLRDPGNKPHVTMEAEVESWEFKQIHGKSNSEPKSEYKAMLKEWMQTLDNPSIDSSFREYDDYHDAPASVDEVPEWLHNAIFRNEEYGMKDDVFDFKFEDAYRESYSALTGNDSDEIVNAGSNDRDSISSVAHTLVRACISHDRSRLLDFQEEMEDNLQNITSKNPEATRFSFGFFRQGELETNALIDKINKISTELDDAVEEQEIENREIDYHEVGDGFNIKTPKDASERNRHYYAMKFMSFSMGIFMEKELKSQLKENPLPVFGWMSRMRGGLPKYTKYQDSNSTKKASLNMNFYKKAHMYSADEDHGDGEGVFGHPDDYMDKRSPGKIRAMAKDDLNGELNHFLSPDGKTEYFGHIPLSDIFDIVESLDMMPVQEDGTRWQGMLLGEEGRATISLRDSEDTFEDLNLHIQWYKMPSGNFEITAYVN